MATATQETAQQIQVLLTQATAQFYQYFNAGNLAAARPVLDQVNCYRQMLQMVPLIPFAGYAPPVNCTELTGVVLVGSLPATSSPAQQPAPAPAQPQTLNNGGTTVAAPKPQSVAIGAGGTCDDSFDPYCCYFPYDPICCIGEAGCAGGGGGGGGGTTIVNETTQIIGEDAATVWSQITGALSSLWSIVVGVFDSVLAAAIAGIQAALTTIANALKLAFETLAHLVGDILKFLDTVLHRLLGVIVDIFRRLKGLLAALWNEVIVPALKALQRLRQYLIYLYEHWIRPLLVWIQRLRQILGILKLLHIKWAAKLDQKLAELEAKITAPLFYLLHYTNMLANWINLIITAGYLIQRPIWLNSLNAYKGSSFALTVNAMNAGFVPPAGAAAGAPGPPPATAVSAQAGEQYMQTGSGPYQPLIDTQTSQFQKYLQGSL